MSQGTLEQTPVGKAFTQTPHSAKYFQQQYQQAQQQQSVETPQGAPAEQAAMQVIAPPRARQSILPPTPRTYSPSQQEQPVVSQEAQQSVQQITPDTPAVDAQLQQQLEAERQMFAQREQQWQQWAQQQNDALEAGLKAQEELAKYQSRAALAQKFAKDETFANLETVDAGDARQLIQLTAEAFEEPLKATSQQLEQLRQQQAQMQQYIAQQTAAMQSQRARDALLTAHPDFFDLYEHNQAFRQFLNTRDGLSYQTREQRAIAEYNAGNAPYLIDLINQFKGTVPKVNDMKTVAPVQVAQAATPYQQPQQTTRYTLADLNYFMQTGQISPDQYREELNKLRAAQQV